MYSLKHTKKSLDNLAYRDAMILIKIIIRLLLLQMRMHAWFKRWLKEMQIYFTKLWDFFSVTRTILFKISKIKIKFLFKLATTNLLRMKPICRKASTVIIIFEKDISLYSYWLIYVCCQHFLSFSKLKCSASLNTKARIVSCKCSTAFINL